MVDAFGLLRGQELLLPISSFQEKRKTEERGRIFTPGRDLERRNWVDFPAGRGNWKKTSLYLEEKVPSPGR